MFVSTCSYQGFVVALWWTSARGLLVIVPPHSMSVPVPVAALTRHIHTQLENMLVTASGEYKLCDFGSVSTRRGVITDKRERIDEEDIIQRFTTPIYRYSTHPLHTRLLSRLFFVKNC